MSFACKLFRYKQVVSFDDNDFHKPLWVAAFGLRSAATTSAI